MVTICCFSLTIKPGEKRAFQIGIDSSVGRVVGLQVKWTYDITWWRVVTKVNHQMTSDRIEGAAHY